MENPPQIVVDDPQNIIIIEYSFLLHEYTYEEGNFGENNLSPNWGSIRAFHFKIYCK
jgi:hypothetical protein